ncbi:unnamed protein product [Allacma fusca]|uniref:TGF-beta family profile domain-containing protein n=1 Tax=Allacma fusca TaxID=39272 RepID=A0A8J2PKR5_9HEXA|nr:unnamed protein product [Allacma fusca]
MRCDHLCPLLLVLTLLLCGVDGVRGRPSGSNQGDPDAQEDPKDVMEELRHSILQDLGFPSLPSNLSATSISHDQFLRAYTQYMMNVRERRLGQRSWRKTAKERRKASQIRLHTFLATSSWKDLNDRHTFPLTRDQLVEAGGLQVKKATLWLPHDCGVIGIGPMDTNGTEAAPMQAWDVSRSVIRWLQKERGMDAEYLPWSAPVVCSQHENAPEAEEDLARLEVVTVKRGMEGEGRVRREVHGNKKLRVSDFADGETEAKERRLGKRRAKDCAELKHGKSCCRKKLQVSFEELKITEVILAPSNFDMDYCDGRCSARRLPYASNHAIFQHMILKKGRGTKLCCSPTKLTEVDVIQRDPLRHDQLKVTVIHNAKVVECGCSSESSQDEVPPPTKSFHVSRTMSQVSSHAPYLLHLSTSTAPPPKRSPRIKDPLRTHTSRLGELGEVGWAAVLVAARPMESRELANDFEGDVEQVALSCILSLIASPAPLFELWCSRCVLVGHSTDHQLRWSLGR